MTGDIDNQFQLLAKWEGLVESVDENGFSARLYDMLQDMEPQHAEFPFSEISPDDRTLVQPGAVFYWSIGYQIELSGQRRRTSSICFRQLSPRFPQTREEVRKAADALAARIGWEI